MVAVELLGLYRGLEYIWTSTVKEHRQAWRLLPANAATDRPRAMADVGAQDLSTKAQVRYQPCTAERDGSAWSPLAP